MRTNSSHRRKGAFSLIEILVSISILVLIVSILSALSLETSQIWMLSKAQNERRATGRALLQIIARDLEMAVVPGSYPSGNATGANLQFVANDAATIPSSLLNPHAAFWQAPVAADRSRGELAEIGYFVRWDTQSQPGLAKAQLCRLEIDPTDTANYQIYSTNTDGTPASWLSLSTINQVAPATAATDYKGWFADNVIAIWIRCLDSQGKPIVQTAANVTLNSGYGFDSRQGYLNPSTSLAQSGPAFPASIDLALVTVDSHTARLITAPIVASPGSPANFGKDASTPGSLANFMATLPNNIKPGAQFFSTRIYLKSSQRNP